MHTGVAIVIGAVCVVVGLVLLWFGAAFCYRFLVVRRGSTSVVLRRLPAEEGAGWRHGVIVYAEFSVRYFRLSSARMFSDLELRRIHVEITGSRVPRGSELEIMDARTPIVTVAGDGQCVEMALDAGALTAFRSWVESRPPERSLRRRPGHR